MKKRNPESVCKAPQLCRMLNMKPITKEQAISMCGRKVWEKWSLEQRGLFQIQQKFLAMPFGKFHEGIEALLKRSVWTHEFVDPKALIEEFTTQERISFTDVLNKIPVQSENQHAKT